MKEDQPSSTAKLITRSLLLMSHDPDHASKVPPRSAEFGRWFLEACGENAGRFDALARKAWYRQLLFWVGQTLTPGLLIHYALRKRRIEEIVRENIAAGAQQVIVLGAGFDTLAWRLHREFPNVTFWELDHPATQNVKRSALTAHEQPGDNFYFAALNLASDRLSDALRQSSVFQGGCQSVFVAEGLLMYLEAKKISEVFQDAHVAGGPASQFVFTFLEPQPDGRVGFALPSRFVDWWLRQRGEPFRWGIAEERLGAFLAVFGWHLQETVTAPVLRMRYVPESQPQTVVGDLIGVGQWKK